MLHYGSTMEVTMQLNASHVVPTPAITAPLFLLSDLKPDGRHMNTNIFIGVATQTVCTIMSRRPRCNARTALLLVDDADCQERYITSLRAAVRNPSDKTDGEGGTGSGASSPPNPDKEDELSNSSMVAGPQPAERTLWRCAKEVLFSPYAKNRTRSHMGIEGCGNVRRISWRQQQITSIGHYPRVGGRGHCRVEIELKPTRCANSSMDGSADGAMTAGVLHTACENAEDGRDRHRKTGETAGVTAEVLPSAFKDGNTGEVRGEGGH
ncbi:hypothetical protein DFH09DRAFT_1097127 [Mycena vulgaris]|nr:hypothetical protein DFH09DRAFT_1097127 [Mycena vulgaris]